MDHATPHPTPVSRASRTRSIAYVGLTIAVLAVSAWVTVPLGPVPFTLQTFAIVFALLALSPKESIAAIAGYLVLGAIGLPVFSGMRGGIGMLAGPTGGFLWGFLAGVALAALLLAAVRRRGFAIEFAAGAVAVVVCYACGWAQYMAVMGVGPVEALLVTVAPFVVIDAIKVAAAVAVANAVARATGRTLRTAR